MSFTNINVARDQLVRQLDLKPEDQAWFIKILELFKPEHGIRAIALDDIREGIKQLFPHALDTYDAFRQQLPAAAPFSFLPASTMALLSVRAGTLAWPGSTARDASWNWSRFGSKRFFKNPLFLMTRQAAENKLSHYLEMSNDSQSQVLNYGRAKLYRLGHNHYEQVCTEQYSAWSETSVVPFMQSLMEEFKVQGTVNFEALNPFDFRLEFQWEDA